ncbi:hypothetical protein ACLQ3H_15885 [Micromonospora saelicesensis]|uniref:hypothetical protein n=1 Tax=Micromonospora saelicesensis TaxID=285676 RepID=UPI003CF9A4C5
MPQVPEAPSIDGAHGTGNVTGYRPIPQSGARPVNVPPPEEVRRPSFVQTDEADEDALDSQRGPHSPSQ